MNDVHDVHADARWQVFPAHALDDFSALTESIRRHGFRKEWPIVVDEDGAILDGHHRALACAKLGVQPVYLVAEGLTDEQKLDLVWDANIARRHLTLEQKRELIRARLRSRPEVSNASVARDLRVAPGTVATIRSDMEAAGEVAETLSSGPDRRRVIGTQTTLAPADRPEEDVYDARGGDTAEHMGTVRVDVIIRYLADPVRDDGAPDVRHRAVKDADGNTIGHVPYKRESAMRERRLLDLPHPSSVLTEGREGYKALATGVARQIYVELCERPLRGAVVEAAA